MSSMDIYGYAGVFTGVGALIGLLLGFILGELAWSVIICTAFGSLSGTLMDSRMPKMGEIQTPLQTIQLDD